MVIVVKRNQNNIYNIGYKDISQNREMWSTELIYKMYVIFC